MTNIMVPAQKRRSMPGLPAPHHRNVSSRWMAAIFFCGLFALAWVVYRPAYYRWILGSKGDCDVILHCDTSEFIDDPVTVLAQYDKTALSPMAKALGLYQNRNPSPASVLYSLKIDDVSMTKTTLKLKKAPRGPLVRITVISEGRSFYAIVRDRTVLNGELHVRLQ